ncbi:TatD family hydrolase [Peptoniphilus equinus]|uniref:TatD family hydrolase n=1 Tax=Peptoniphilus equinus TaxID=3016343 RepID=A0ABY7QWZ7_9FIRM|nr:TatD family hydrolase [Peptoniphilus equinus]WBW50753.1 TatD family hydrolase [Peptoniphilus equinus]
MIDSHAHLDDEKFDYDRDMLICNLAANGVDRVYNVGSDLPSSETSVELAKIYDNIRAVIGVHPHEASTYDDAVEARLMELAEDEHVKAIGEIGLDYYYDLSPRDVQREVFKRQIELAHHVELPVVIHTREAVQETFDIIAEAVATYPQMKFLIHCFTQPVEMMARYVELGAYIALGGAVTFKNARHPKEVAKIVPLDRLLLETDAPYLAPVPMRGKRNEPMFIKHTAREIAGLRGMKTSELIDITAKNAKDFFND